MILSRRMVTRFAPPRRVLAPWAAATAGLLMLTLQACNLRPASLRVPVSNWPGYEYFYLASKLGLDKPLGLDIEPAQYPDPQSIVHAYLRGEVPIAQLTTVEAVDLCGRSPQRCPTIVLVLDESLGGDQVALLKSVPSLRDLKGKSVAVTFSTLGPYVLHRALERNGLSLKDVSVRNMPLARMPSALATNEVQAAAFFPPFSEYAERDGHSRVAFDSSQIPGEIFDVLVVDPTYLKDHGREVTQLIRIWRSAHAAAQRSPEQAVALMAAREQLTPAEFRNAEKGLRYFPLKEQEPLLAPNGPIARNLRAVQAVQQQLGLSASDARLPSSTNQYVKQALQP